MEVKRTVILPRGSRFLLLLLTVGLLGACDAGGGSTPEDTGSGSVDVVEDVPGLPDSGGLPDTVGQDVGKPDTQVVDVPVAPDVPVEPDVSVQPDIGEDVYVPPACPEGDTCDDGDPCTEDDVCDADGNCVGTAISCDDGRACTRDFCDATGACATELLDDWCLIDAVCYEAGALAEDVICHHCDPTESVVDWVPVDNGHVCNDQDACTIDDHCFAGACVSDESVSCPASTDCVLHACDFDSGDCVETLLSGTACDDGDACTIADTCDAGTCTGEALVCPEAATCESVSCDSELGCRTERLDDVSCDDGNACTVDDTCLTGDCVGTSIDCDDGNDCTADSCNYLLGCDHEAIENLCCSGGQSRCDDGDPCTEDTCSDTGGCQHSQVIGACDDGNACTEDDVCDADGTCAGVERDCDDDNVCTADSCDSGWGCLHDPVSGDCDDGDPCTVAGRCVGGSCVSDPMDCDDGDPCTLDSCSEGVCAHELSVGLACNDGDACTIEDACQADGQCAGTTNECNDDDPCTTDLCNSLTGCYHGAVDNALAILCDDGDECTLDDTCVDGLCVGSPGGCACVPELSPDANKINALEIGINGHPGNGLDVDGDPTTCAPTTAGCSEGIDNSMAGLSGAANGPLGDAVADGSLFLLFEHIALQTDGSPYTLALLIGEPVSETCDFQAETCDYLVQRSSFDEESCDPLILFAGATITDGVLDAGGPDATFPFQIPIQDGLVLEVVIYSAHIVADVTMAGDDVAELDGVIAGAIPKQQLIDAVEAVPEETFTEIGITKSFVLTLVDALITNDIDTDGDGTADAASIGIPFHAIGATLAGLEAVEE